MKFLVLMLLFAFCSSSWGINIDSLKTEANEGDAIAMYDLGNCYKKGTGVSKDMQQAVRWFKKSAEQGFNEGIFFFHMGENSDNATIFYFQAVLWFKKSAELGNSDAMFYLGSCYYCGKGVTKDYTQAVYWVKKSAELGNSDAMLNLGVCYHNGEGVLKDINQALFWTKKSAELGNSTAMYNLGNSYYYGDGVLTDPEQAIYWYQKAVDLGYVKASLNLGIIYLKDYQDAKKAKPYIKFAYENGNSEVSQKAKELWEEYQLWKY